MRFGDTGWARRCTLFWLLGMLACSETNIPPAVTEAATDSVALAPLEELPSPPPTPDVVQDPPELPPSDSLPPRDTSEEVVVADVKPEQDTTPKPPPLPWRSALYPEDWSPDFSDSEGRFLHDMSYAGYQQGPGVGVTAADAPVFSVLDSGADPTGVLDSTAAIQATIDAAEAAGGGVVWFDEGLYRVDDVLTVQASHVVLRGAGPELSRLAFSRSQGMSYLSHITVGTPPQQGADFLLVNDAANRAFDVEVADASTLTVGQDVAVGWVITPEFIAEHGMTGTWMAFNDTWQPFFRRTIAAIDTESTPHRVTLDVPLRYPALLRDQASLRVESGLIAECGVEHLGLGNAVDWESAWLENQVHVLQLVGVKDAWVHDVHSFSPPSAPSSGAGGGDHLQSGGILIRFSKRVTVADSAMSFPEHRGGGGNGYLFEVRQSSEVLFRDSVARGGRHNFIQNWGFGASGIVWLRVHSLESNMLGSVDFPFFEVPTASEFHHSLAMACLIDASVVDDSWKAENRRKYSSGAGHSVTQSVFWNVTGEGWLTSRQAGWGYVIGTADGMSVKTSLSASAGKHTEPEDWVEGEGAASVLEPASLYEDQRARRLGESSD